MDGIWMPLLADMGRSVPSLMAGTGLFAKTILLILFVISVISWAIIWDRARLYLRLRKRGALARNSLARNGLRGTLANLNSFVPSIEGSILEETERFLQGNRSKSIAIEAKSGRRRSDEGAGPLRTTLDRRAIEEMSEMEKYLVFLATTSSAAPFLGLLGTVWGIMSSFLSMGVQGTASLEVVGPGIAEALVTTIAGLGAAIPALIGYNLLVRHVRRQETRLDLFISRIVEETIETNLIGTGAKSEAEYEKNSV